MSFRFNFSNASDSSLNIEDSNGDQEETSPPINAVASTPHSTVPAQFHSLEDLVSTLPENISYNTLATSQSRTNTSNAIRIPRRELYDVRMQLMAEDENLPSELSDTIEDTSIQITNQSRTASKRERDALLEFVNGNEDVRTGVYEGGLKSWECSIDLVQWLSSHDFSLWDNAPGGGELRVLELGCGTSLPSLYLFQTALRDEQVNREGNGGYTFHFADYNYSVLRLVTMPNIFLSWILHAHPELLTLPNGDLAVTEELQLSFLTSLRTANIHLGFISGGWSEAMLSILHSHHNRQHNPSAGYDLVLGSETIYEPKTMGEFTKVFLGSLEKTEASRGLVSAKRIYFGVGGSVAEFMELVQSHADGWDVREVESVGRGKGGVGGVILEVRRKSGNERGVIIP